MRKHQTRMRKKNKEIIITKSLMEKQKLLSKSTKYRKIMS